MAKKVPVTSVTPASKVKAVSKEQQARTRNLVMGIATATPAGRAVKAAATVAKAAKTAKVASAAQKKAYKEKVTIPAKRVVKEAKKELKIESKALKAANKPTKASKTFIGNNNKLSPSVRRDIIVNQTKPARPNRERGGSLSTLRKQGKTSPTPPRNKSK